jgi:hypothetical protein
MNDLPVLIRDLDDSTAERILASVSRHRIRSGAATEIPLTQDLAQALASAAGTPPAAQAVRAGDLARQSLLLLAEDPAQEPVLRAMIENPPAQRLADPLAVLAVGTAALCVLQSAITIQRDKEGKWSFQFKKDPLSNPLLKLLIEKISGFLAWQ